MNRIAPDRVVAAFKRHPQVQPVQDKFVGVDARGETPTVMECCGLTSQLLGTEHALLAPDGPSSREHVCKRIAEVLGVSTHYAFGFSLGWDNTGLWCAPDSDEGRAGYEDGKAAWEAVNAAAAS